MVPVVLVSRLTVVKPLPLPCEGEVVFLAALDSNSAEVSLPPAPPPQAVSAASNTAAGTVLHLLLRML